MNKKFHLGDILSVTTGFLLSPEGIDGVYKILNHLTGDSLFTHQLPRAAEACTPFLLQQFPQLSELDPKGDVVNEGTAKVWLELQVEKFGDIFSVESIPNGYFQHRDPVEELTEMMGSERVVTVAV